VSVKLLGYFINELISKCEKQTQKIVQVKI